jgi:hypothetical protein
MIQSGPFEGVTSYRSEHAGIVAPPAQPFRPPQSIPAGSDNRDFITENKSSFSDKGYQVRQPMRPIEAPRADLPFEAESIYRSSFQRTGARPAQPILPVQRQLVSQEDRDFLPESAKFEFKGYCVRPMLKPIESVVNNGKFDAQTTYQANFGFKELPRVPHNVHGKIVPVFGNEQFPESTFGQTAMQAAQTRQFNSSQNVPQYHSAVKHAQTYYTPSQLSTQRSEFPTQRAEEIAVAPPSGLVVQA